MRNKREHFEFDTIKEMKEWFNDVDITKYEIIIIAPFMAVTNKFIVSAYRRMNKCGS